MPERSSEPNLPATPQRPMSPMEERRYAWLQQRWAGHPDLLAEIDAELIRQLSRPAPPPCPDWCTEENHDGYDDMINEPGRQMRCHILHVTTSVVIVVGEIREPDDTTSLTAPTIEVDLPSEIDAAEARKLGEGLIRAADRMGEISRWAAAA